MSNSMFDYIIFIIYCLGFLTIANLIANIIDLCIIKYKKVRLKNLKRLKGCTEYVYYAEDQDDFIFRDYKTEPYLAIYSLTTIPNITYFYYIGEL